jgi:hypothetical protein
MSFTSPIRVDSLGVARAICRAVLVDVLARQLSQETCEERDVCEPHASPWSGTSSLGWGS